jgi:hypothetical protein
VGAIIIGLDQSSIDVGGPETGGEVYGSLRPLQSPSLSKISE